MKILKARENIQKQKKMFFVYKSIQILQRPIHAYSSFVVTLFGYSCAKLFKDIIYSIIINVLVIKCEKSVRKYNTHSVDMLSSDRWYSLVIHAEDVIQVILFCFIFNQQLHLQENTSIWYHPSSLRPLKHTVSLPCFPVSYRG